MDWHWLGAQPFLWAPMTKILTPICGSRDQWVNVCVFQIHTGLQHGIIWSPQPNGLPLEDRTIADELKAAGYATHVVGKWHLGFYRKQYTPTYRGFDSFFGEMITLHRVHMQLEKSLNLTWKNGKSQWIVVENQWKSLKILIWWIHIFDCAKRHQI